MTEFEKKILNDIFNRYHANKVEQKPRQICKHCGKPRVLGSRGSAKFYCKKCRKVIA